jgi:hypothetical protein
LINCCLKIINIFIKIDESSELLKGPSGPFHSELGCHWTCRWYFETCTPTANGGRPHFIRDNFLDSKEEAIESAIR